MFIARDMMLMALTVALSVAIKMTGGWYETENEKQELKKAQAEAELQNLKSQLNPHFLFNTLNNIYSLIAINQARPSMLFTILAACYVTSYTRITSISCR